MDITKRIGITLTDTYQMVPSKSVTAFIGIRLRSKIRNGFTPSGTSSYMVIPWERSSFIAGRFFGTYKGMSLLLIKIVYVSLS